VLLHIGPPKTGTTSIQAAFDRAREAVLKQGVRYAGRKRHSREAVLAATGSPSLVGAELASGRREWAAIVREVRAAGEERVLFSSERLAHADSDHIRAIVEQLDPQRVHVVTTLRPLSKILPAQWQQAVQSGLVEPFDAWLRATLEISRDNPRSFWQRHDHARLVERWGGVVGPDRVRVIVVDEVDRERLLRSFEGLLGLRYGTLRLHRDLSNRSLTYPEAEAIRAFNLTAGDELSGPVHRRIVELGASFRMRQREPEQGAASIVLPAWARPAVATVSDEIVQGLAASGVDVDGGLDRLRVAANEHGDRAGEPAAAAGGPAAAVAQPVCITPAVAAALTMGVLESTGALPARRDLGTGPGKGGAALDRVPFRRLVGVVARRTARAGIVRARAVRSRIA